MNSRRILKEIKGTIHPPLKDVGINLFIAADREMQKDNGMDICIYREKRIIRTTTDEKGKFRFCVCEGTYCVNLDIETLPIGKGVETANKLVPIGDSVIIDFEVRDAASIDIGRMQTRMRIGEQITVNTVVRDLEGRILTARLNYTSESNELYLRSNLCRSIPKSLKEYSANILVDAGKTKKRVSVHLYVPGLCSAERIKLAGKLGLIDEQMKMQYLAQALFQAHKLPDEYRSKMPIKSGTGILNELNKYLESRGAEPKTVEAVRLAISAPVPELDKVYRSPSGYFNIHYTLSGDNSVVFSPRYPDAVPYYITQVGEAFDKVRAMTCFTRGFREPVLQDNQKGYDIYIYDLVNLYGVTHSSTLYSSPNTGSRTASSYICIDNSYSKEKGFDKDRLECMKVTAAHEFFHAVQYAYNVDADNWWIEASATWNEDEIYSGINDYVRYIESYLKEPNKPLDETSYSGVIFVKFLSENYGGWNSIRKIWELQSAGYNNSIQSIDRFLKNSFTGKDIGSIYNQFSTYNTNPAQYYKEGASWNVSVSAQNTYAKYPIAESFGQLNHLSSNYQLFRPSDSSADKSLRIVIDGSDDARWGFKLQKRNVGNKLYSSTEILSRGIYSRAEIELAGFGTTYDEIWLIPANLETNRNRMLYAYSADLK